MIKQIISIFIINLIVNSYFSLLNLCYNKFKFINNYIIIRLIFKKVEIIFLNIFLFYYLFGFLCNNFLL